MADQPLIAYPPIKRIIKLEIPDKHQAVNSGEEDNWTLQVQHLLFLFLKLYNQNVII